MIHCMVFPLNTLSVFDLSYKSMQSSPEALSICLTRRMFCFLRRYVSALHVVQRTCPMPFSKIVTIADTLLIPVMRVNLSPRR